MEDYLSFIIIFSVTAISLFLILFLKYRSACKDSKVMEHSKKILALLALNENIGFYHPLEKSFEAYKHYDNKSHFNKIEPAYLMTAGIQAELPAFLEYSQKIKSNRAKEPEYKQAVREIYHSQQYTYNFESIGISKRSFLRREKKLFFRNILVPVTDCTYTVHMTYSSKKGQVNLQKTETFDFDALFTSLESISRKRLDKKYYAQLALVERGDVSDSLRYDILRRDNFKCSICGASAAEGARLHVDHILPIAKGGKSTPQNLRTLCERCNIGKSSKLESPIPAQNVTQDTNLICPYCRGQLVVRSGSYGEFYGCSNFPRCKFTKDYK